MLLGYARTSTVEQHAGFEAQKRELEQVGCDKIFAEQVSSVSAREKLEAALDFVREGDVFVCHEAGPVSAQHARPGGHRRQD
jgi:DNA invertase Pin-like site-specific DNA recombinase